MSAAPSTPSNGRSPPWKMLAKIATGVIVAVVIVLLFRLGRTLDWPAVFDAARSIGTPTIALAFAVVCIGYLIYASFDLLARHYAGHHMSSRRVVAIALISYALNLNLGVLVGGIAIRFRLYRQFGVGHAMAARVVVFSTTTNWIGYCWLAGVLFMADLVPVPGGWDVGRTALQFIGLLLFSTALIYTGLCAFSARRKWTLRGQVIELPSGSTAMLQSGLSITSWMLMGSIVYILLGGGIEYWKVLGILLFASIAAVIAHIPGGLGVTEAIFVAALSSKMDGHDVLASLLMYRMLYGLVPLSLALIAYLGIEIGLKKKGRHRKAPHGSNHHRGAAGAAPLFQPPRSKENHP